MPTRVLWGRVTVLWVAVLQNGLAVGAAFGLHLTPQQVVAIVVFANSFGAALAHTGATSEGKQEVEVAQHTNGAEVKGQVI